MAEASKVAAGGHGSAQASSDAGADASLWEQLKGLRGSSDKKVEDDTSASWTLDRIFTTLAAVLLPLGVAMIGLAWYGAAHTPFIFEQIPYMISGGLLGLGLLTTGGLLYVGTWIARLAEAQREQSAQLREVLEGLREDLRAGVAGESADAAGTGAGAGAGAAPAGFVATPTGSMFHRQDCSIVADRTDLHAVNGRAPDLQPCKMCDPLEYESSGA